MRTQSDKRSHKDIAERALCESKEASDAGRQIFEKYREKLTAYDTDRLSEDEEKEEVPAGEKIPGGGN